MTRPSPLPPFVLAALLSAAIPLSARPAGAQGHPAIDGLTPTEGPPGTIVTITGRGFSPALTVYLHESILPIVRRTRTRLVVRIPRGAQTGNVLVTYGDEEEGAGEFRVTGPARAAWADERALLVRMRRASPAQIRALVAPEGVEVCDVSAPSDAPETRSCRRYTRATLTDAVVRRRVAPMIDALLGIRGGFPGIDFECTPGSRLRCETPSYQGVSHSIEFVGEGPARRVARLASVDRMIGE